MTAALHAASGRPARPPLDRLVVVGTVLTGLPLLLGPVMAAVMLTGRLEEPSNAFGALWSAPLVALPAALAGAVCLAVVVRRDRDLLHAVLALAGLAVTGAAGGVLVPEVAGLDGQTVWSPSVVLLIEVLAGVFVLLYAVCLLALTAIGVRRMTRRLPETPRHALKP